MTFECATPPSSAVIHRLITDSQFNKSIGETEYDNYNNDQYYGCFHKITNGNTSSYTKSNSVSRTNVGFTTSIAW